MTDPSMSLVNGAAAAELEKKEAEAIKHEAPPSALETAAMMAATLEAINNRKRASDTAAIGPSPLKRPTPGSGTGGLMVVKLVCPDVKAGAVIGKGGSHIKALREQTGADVMIEKSVPGTADRIVQLSSSPAPIAGMELSAVQAALLMVVDKIVADDTPLGRPAPVYVEFRILVDRASASAVAAASGGPPGTVLLDVKKYCGASVTVAPGSGRPAAATPNEELIKVTGSFESVREGLRIVTDRVRDSVLNVATAPLPSRPHPAAASAATAVPPIGPQPAAVRSGGPPGADTRPPRPPVAPGAVQTEYRLVVLDNKIGCILGKGGALAKTIREQTGSDMRIERVAPGAVDRMVVCISSEPPESDFCCAADAMMVCLDKLVQDHVLQVSRNGDIGPFRGMLLVRASQAPVVLARGGATLMQIQQSTQARVVLLPREAMPACAEATDSAILLEGAPESVLAAVRSISIVLRGCQVREHLGLPQVDGTGAILPPQPGPPPHQRGPPPPKTAGPAGRQADEAAQSAVQRFLANLAETQAGAAGGPRTPGAAPPGRSAQAGAFAPGAGASSATAIALGASGVVRVTMTVGQAQAAALLGKGGATMQHIRSASGAKIKLHDQPTIGGERELEITGTPEQATAARTMISSVLGADGGALGSTAGLPPPASSSSAAQLYAQHGSANPYAQQQQEVQQQLAGAFASGAAPAAAGGYYQAQAVPGPPGAPSPFPPQFAQGAAPPLPAAQQYDPLYAQQYAQYYQQPGQPPAPQGGAPLQAYGQPPVVNLTGGPPGQQFAGGPPQDLAASQQAQYAAYQLQVQQYNAAVLAQQELLTAATAQPAAPQQYGAPPPQQFGGPPPPQQQQQQFNPGQQFGAPPPGPPPPGQQQAWQQQPQPFGQPPRGGPPGGGPPGSGYR